MHHIPSNPRGVNRWYVIPPEWKKDVDTSLLKVLSSNRKYIKHLEGQVQKISSFSPQTFLEDLVSSWYNHNKFFSSLYPFLSSLPKNGSITQSQGKIIQRILDDMKLVDTITLLYSLAIKPILQRNYLAGNIVPPFDSFHIAYIVDHHDFIRNNISLEDIIQKYHGGSIELFKQRKSKGILLELFDGRISDEKIEELKEAKEKTFLNALYDFYIDKPKKIKSLVEISTIDNFDEYRFLYNLEGIEGFYLKDFLVRNQILKSFQGKTGITFNYFDTLEISMDSLHKSSNTKELPFYIQSTPVSCASTCAMMVSNLFFNEQISEILEKELYAQMKSSFLDGCPFSKVAYKMAVLYPDLNIELVHENPNFFNDSKVVDLFQDKGTKTLEEYKSFARLANSKGVEIKIVKDYIRYLQKILESGGVHMISTELNDNILHSELVLSNVNGYFEVYDPLRGSTYSIPEEEFIRKTHTSLGTWGISFYSDPYKLEQYNSSIKFFREKKEELSSYGISLPNT